MTDKDGIDHINIYSKGKMPLGRYLSNFTYSPFKHPFDGDFKSVEGYWYYNITLDEKQRDLSGFKAKERGRKYLKQINPEGNEWQVNETHVKLAIICKLTQNNPEMLQEFISSTLPFKHYYVYGDKIVEPKEGQWLITFFEELRTLLQE